MVGELKTHCAVLGDEVNAEAKEAERPSCPANECPVGLELRKADRDLSTGPSVTEQHHAEQCVGEPLSCLVWRLRGFPLPALAPVFVRR